MESARTQPSISKFNPTASLPDWTLECLFGRTIYGLTAHDKPVQPDEAAFHLILNQIEELPPAPDDQYIIHSSPYLSRQGSPISQYWRHIDDPDASMRVRYWISLSDQIEFLINQSGTQLQVNYTIQTNKQDILPSLLGPVMAILLRVRGVTALHAGVIALNGNAVAFIGDKGAGKSSLLLSFASQGIPILCDDIAAFDERDGQFFIRPAYARLRAWEDSIAALTDLNPEQLEKVHSLDRKRWINLSGSPEIEPFRFQPNPLPLKAIYYLAPRQPDMPIAITQIPPSDRLFLLARHAFVDRILDKTMRARDFERMTRIAQTTPILQLNRPDDLTTLPDVCQQIMQTTQSL